MSNNEEFSVSGLLKLLFGLFLFCYSAPGLYYFFTTGKAYSHGSFRFPIDLYGPDAAVKYAITVLFGVFLIYSGYRSLVGKARK